jgi:hypothetical protein
MIPAFVSRAALAPLALAALCGCGHPESAPTKAQPATAGLAKDSCLASGDGYLRATVAGDIEMHLDWPNSGTHCNGESRDSPPGVRLSFQRDGSQPNLLLVFGLSGVRAGEPAREVATNLTVIEQGTDKIFGTLGDSRCTVDSLTQKQLPGGGNVYRLEARGFCTQPAHAVRGKGDVLVSTFEFAGPVSYFAPDTDHTSANLHR